LKTAEFGALNPRRRVPVLVDDDFALAESAAVAEYIGALAVGAGPFRPRSAPTRDPAAHGARSPMTIWPTSASVWRRARDRRTR
jgi:glutathione S-transferase